MATDTALFYFDNLTEQGTFTVTSADSECPKENLQNRDQHTYWKPGDVTDPQVFDLDLGSAMTFNAMTIISLNLYSKSIGIKMCVDLNDQASFANPVYLVGSGGAYHAVTSADHPIWHETFTAKTKRYVRWIVNTGGDTDVIIYAINLWAKLDIGRHPGGPWDRSFDSAAEGNRGHVINATRTRSPKDEAGLQFLAVSKTVRDAILAGFDICDVLYKPFLYIDEYEALKYMRFTATPKSSHRFGPYHDLSIQVVEDY